MAKLNAVGEGLDIKGMVPLLPASLISQATSNTGLADFGGDHWLQHFNVLMKAVDDEAELHLAGRLLTRCEILLYLEARLRIVDAYKRDPKIDNEKIDRPVFITGYGRSGTTILFEVLAQDPQFRVASKSLETEYAAFLSDVYPIIFQIPSYAKYLATQDLTEAIEWRKKTLKLLQSKFKARHWLMKSPSHLPHLRKILNVFPDMRVIFTHRDPVVTADSIVSVMGMLYWLRTDRPWGNGAIESWSLSLAEDRASAWTDIIAMINSGDLAKGNFTNFHYVEFMADPIAAIHHRQLWLVRRGYRIYLRIKVR